MIQKITSKIPEFCMSHWLIRIPLIVVFLQQGFDKWPIDADTAAGFELTLLVWTFVVLGEIGAGVGLFVGGVLSHFKTWIKELGDLITRFSGIVITGIMTGVIWVGQPDSFMDVILYDNLHVLLWVGGMYFALRGNRT
jgi:putative oxidoreductase